MGKPLSIVYCQSCGCSHEPGKHSNKPSPKDLNPVMQKPKKPKPRDLDEAAIEELMVTILSTPGVTFKPTHVIVPARAMIEQKPKVAKRKRKPLREGFDKVHFQRDYMKVRREADAAGYGGSNKRDHPKFNPNYMTVKQYLAFKAKTKPISDTV